MNLTVEEKIMYNVMRAIYDSGIPISFKGSMVLRACLIEAGCPEETRHTVDMDANWNSDVPPSPDQMVKSIQNAITKGGIDLNVNLYRMYGEGRSAGFELSDTNSGEILFTMDIDVNRPTAQTKIYELEEMRFKGVAPIQMIADKVASVSTDKIFRRIKDVADLYYISKVFDFDCDEVNKTLKYCGRVLGDFDVFLHEQEKLKHAYEIFRFSGDARKPTFEEVYNAVKSFIGEILPE